MFSEWQEEDWVGWPFVVLALISAFGCGDWAK
jgi:hypothetical protein